jgi:hypothetical protein
MISRNTASQIAFASAARVLPRISQAFTKDGEISFP